MNANNSMYNQFPAISELNKVAGFEPRKLMSKRTTETGVEVLYLDLKYRKLWFRLKHPTGRIRVKTLLINEQRAIFEAKVYLDKNDAEPVASFTAQRYAAGKLGSLYVESAQYEAVSQALDDAGFGLQFCDMSCGSDAEMYGKGAPAHETEVIQVIEESERPAPQDTPVSDAAKVIADAASPEPPAKVLPTMTCENREPDTSSSTCEEASVELQQETPGVEPAEQSDDAQPEPQAENTAFAIVETEAAAQPSEFTGDMPVEKILELMTAEDAAAVVVDTGTCKGWTLAEVAEKRPASLKWYLNGYTGENNLLRAGARLLLDRSLLKAG